MTKNFVKRIIIFTALTMIAAMLLCSCGTSAVAVGSSNYVVFKMSSDYMTLTNGEKTYYLYTPSERYKLDADYMFGYRHKVSVGNDDLFVYSYKNGGEIVWLGDSKMPSLIYATEEGQDMLDSFFKGDVISYTLDTRHGATLYSSKLEKETVGALNTKAPIGSETKTMPVSILKFYDRYDVIAHDSIDTFASVVGAIYDIDGDLYYIDYSTLGDQYFDFMGDFSYGYGEIELTKLTDKLLEAVEEVIKAKRPSYGGIDIEFEEHPGSHGGVEYGDSNGALVAFWIMYVLVGFVTPVAFAVVSAVTANKAKLGRPRYWYVGSAIGGIWIILAAILMMILII